MQPTAPLAELIELDSHLVYMFLAGPGEGEGIAVHLPGGAWLVVDGCVAGDGDLPLKWVLDKYRSKGTAVGMILTHPHQDHCKGFAELLDVLDPSFIAVTGGAAPGNNLVRLLEALWASQSSQVTSDVIRSRAVRAAIKRIRVWEDDHTGQLVALRDGQVLPSLSPEVTIYVRAPDTARVDAFLADVDLQRRVRSRANELSAVVEIILGASRIVLTGDLPRYHTGTTTSVATGWDTVMASHTQLGSHTVLKLPHHGSAAAFHPKLMVPEADGDRVWSLTPYNSSRLPRIVELDGLPQLLELSPRIHLTALPASKKVQPPLPAPGVVPISRLARRLDLQSTGEPFIDEGVEIRPGEAVGASDPIWVVGLNGTGQVVGRWRGTCAMEVVRDE